MPRITKTLIKNTEPKKQRFYVWDSTPPGFGLVVYPTGVKSYVFQYRTPQGRTRRATIGKVEKYTPEQARLSAHAMAEKVRNKLDPLEQKRAALQEQSVAHLLDDYLASAYFSAKATSRR